MDGEGEGEGEEKEVGAPQGEIIFQTGVVITQTEGHNWMGSYTPTLLPPSGTTYCMSGSPSSLTLT